MLNCFMYHLKIVDTSENKHIIITVTFHPKFKTTKKKKAILVLL